MTDCALVFDYLASRPGWHCVVDMMRFLKPDAVNWALRSRVSDLNRKFAKEGLPYKIESRLGESGCADYRLVSTDEPKFFEVENQRCFA